MAPLQLIHSNQQFAQLRPAMERYAGCVDPTRLPVLPNPLLLILTTQRTGSTLLCQDIASAWQLPYQPIESFINPLTGVFNSAIPPDSLTTQLANTFNQHAQSPCSVFKLMADYIGWLGFFCAPKEQALTASYSELSGFFLNRLQSQSTKGFQLIKLERKHKLKQAISRLFNCMGLPPHIVNDADQQRFDARLKEKLKTYPNLDLMVIDQLRIILSQCRLIEAILSPSTGITSNDALEYERDLCGNPQTYLHPLSARMGLNAGRVQRQLRRTSGAVSRDLLIQTLQRLGLEDNGAQPTALATLVSA